MHQHSDATAVCDQEVGQHRRHCKFSRLTLQIDAKRVLREIIIMKNCAHENILGLQDVIYVPRPGRVIGEIYLVCDIMETDMSRIIRSKQALQIDHI